MISIIERAKFFFGEGTGDSCGWRGHAATEIPAVLEIDGIRLMSETPKSAAQAAKINEAVERLAAK